MSFAFMNLTDYILNPLRLVPNTLLQEHSVLNCFVFCVV